LLNFTTYTPVWYTLLISFISHKILARSLDRVSFETGCICRHLLGGAMPRDALFCLLQSQACAEMKSECWVPCFTYSYVTQQRGGRFGSAYKHHWCSQIAPGSLLTYSVVLVRKRTIPTERPPLGGEVSTNLCG
jgi:hypothetical protein